MARVSSSRAVRRSRKLYDLIHRFSEDIDVTVFRDDLDEAGSVEDLQALSSKKRRAKLDAIRDACRAYVTGPFREALTGALNTDTAVSRDRPAMITFHRDSSDPQTYNPWPTQGNPA